MIGNINEITKSIVDEIRTLDRCITTTDMSSWAMRIIISVAFRNSMPDKWLAAKFHEYLGKKISILRFDRQAQHRSLFLWDYLFGKLGHYLPFPNNIKIWRIRRELTNKIIEAMDIRKEELKDSPAE